MQYPVPIYKILSKVLDFPKIICNYKLSLCLFSTFVSRNKSKVLGCCVSDLCISFLFGVVNRENCTWVEGTFHILSLELILRALLMKMVTALIVACECTIPADLPDISHCEKDGFTCSTSLLGLFCDRKLTRRGYVEMEKQVTWPGHCWVLSHRFSDRSRTCLIGCEVKLTIPIKNLVQQ